MKFDIARLKPLMGLNCDYSDRVHTLVNDLPNQIAECAECGHFTNSDITDGWNEKAADIFCAWRSGESTPPSLYKLVLRALNDLNIDNDHALVPVTIAAAILGMVNHKNPYHNNHHFREVACLTIKLCAVHNVTEKNPDLMLSQGDILLLLAAACIHDFAHDGSGNIIDGIHVPSRLEKRAVAKSKPFFEALNMSFESLAKLERLVLATDVSRGNQGRSPAGYTRDIYLAHEHDNVAIVNAPNDYNALTTSHKLSLMAMLLCEADIGISSSLNYAFSKDMTTLVAMESSVLTPSASTLFGFMDVICHGGFLTKAAQKLLGDEFDYIMQLAEEDSRANILYA